MPKEMRDDGKEDAVKVAITLSRSSVEFFKREAGKHDTPYRKMIHTLLDACTDVQRK